MRRIFSILVCLTVCVLGLNAQTVKSADIDELHVSGPCALRVIHSQDSAGLLAGQLSDAVEFRRVGSAMYIAVNPSAVKVGRLPLRLYVGKTLSLQLLELSGRAEVSADSISSQGYLSLVSSGGASANVTSLSAPNVNVSLTGSGKIKVSGQITASTLNFSLVGSGVINVNGLTASRLTVSQRGSGKMIFAGSSRDCDVVVRGTGVVDLRNLVSGMMDLRMLGAGHIYYPSGVRVSLSGDSENIVQVKPYQPL